MCCSHEERLVRKNRFPPVAVRTLPRGQRGSALVEYTVVVLLLVVVLVATDGNVIRDLAEEVRKAYASFVYALSISWA